jgi:signal transduction histidine kinase
MDGDGSVAREGITTTAPDPDDRWRSLQWASVILAVLIGTVLALIVSGVYSRRAAAKLDRAAMSIAGDASPAIEDLAAIREQILRVTVVAAEAVGRPADGARLDAGELARPLAHIRRDLSAYRALPFYPREELLYATVDGKLRAFETRTLAFSALMRAGDRPGASALLRRELLPSATDADAGIADLTSFNVEQQHQLAIDIPTQRRRAAAVGFGLQLVTGLLGLVLTGLVLLGTRRYTRLVQARRRAADDQARSVAEFGTKLEAIIGSCVDIAGTITASGDPMRVFQLIADEARMLAGARYAAVGCGTDRTRPFEPWISSGMPGSTIAALGRAPRPDGLLGAVVQEGQSIRLADVTQHPFFRGLPKGHPPLGSFIGVPIIRDGQNVANLFLAREPGQAPFSAQDERAADLLAGFVAVALENAALYDRALAARRAREDLLATVSHDLKNTLYAIRLATRVLAGRVEDDKAKQSVARIDRAADRMSRLIGDLLDAAKIEAGALRAAPQAEDAASLVETGVELLRLIAADKNIQLVAEPVRARVSCERSLILRVLGNLIGNAVKFSASGSVVSIRAELNPGHVLFSVADTGPGIPAEQAAHAFERYWQQEGSDRRGSGLGLYIAKGIVEAHGGRIWIESTPGCGTTVRFTLPLAAAGASDAAPPRPDPAPAQA